MTYKDGVVKIIASCLCLRSSCSRGVTGEGGTCASGLDAAEALQLLGLDGYLLTESNLASRATDERHTVRVHALVDRGRARLSAGNGDTSGGLLSHGSVVTLTKRLDDSSLHRELDPVERDEPDNILEQSQTKKNIQR